MNPLAVTSNLAALPAHLLLTADVRASEDVPQEVYLRAWRDLKSLKNPESFLPWIRQLTRNQAITFARGRRRYEKRHTEWEADSVDVAAHEAGTLDRALARLERLRDTDRFDRKETRLHGLRRIGFVFGIAVGLVGLIYWWWFTTEVDQPLLWLDPP